MQDKPLNLVWMRRDLRLHDHAALHHALKGPGVIQPVFVFDTEILARFANPLDRRLTFLAQVMLDLDSELRARGGGMLVLHGPATEVMPRLAQALGAAQLVAAADIEGPTRARDASVAQVLSGITKMSLVKDAWIRHGGAVNKKDGTPYHVFTPYAKAWRATLTPEDLAERVVEDKGRYAHVAALRAKAYAAGLRVLDLSQGLEALLEQIGFKKADITHWGTREGEARLHRFVETRLKNYSHDRNMLAEDGTSRLSPYLRHGLVSVRECARLAWDRPGAEGWVNELIWRDFYAMILYHYPETATEEFLPKFRRTLNWRRVEADFEAWKAGRTGYPVVDAAMRQMQEIGWMHNRARMIVASFLCKHLRIDWRLGEEHFAQHLMDYDLASNAGGWQWAASTGTDAQPYFRVFNPTTQGEKFDPEGEYVRRYVPELGAMKGKKVHQPWGDAARGSYPAPIVDHASARAEALRMFKEVA
jgi:deoxyribodipyrimidine photo-lyase